MRKIGGVNMDTIAHLSKDHTKEKASKRYCSISESLRDSLREVKLHRQGKLQLGTWDEFLQELKQDKE